MDTKYILSIGIAWIFLAVIIGNILYAMPSERRADVVVERVVIYRDIGPKAKHNGPEQAKAEVCIKTADNDCSEFQQRMNENTQEDVNTRVNIQN